MGKVIKGESSFNWNKTGLQPISRPVEKILGFYTRVFKKYPKKLQMGAMRMFKKLTAPSTLPNL